MSTWFRLLREQVEEGVIDVDPWKTLKENQRHKLATSVGKVLSEVMANVPVGVIAAYSGTSRDLVKLPRRLKIRIGSEGQGVAISLGNNVDDFLILYHDSLEFSKSVSAAKISTEFARAIVANREAMLAFVKRLQDSAEIKPNEFSEYRNESDHELDDKSTSPTVAFKRLYKNTNKPLSSVVSQLKRWGVTDKEIYSIILDVLGDLVWEE